MTLRVRIVAALLFVAACSVAAAMLLGGDRPGVVDTDDAAGAHRWQTSLQCKPCHEDVWAEWHGTQHQIAYLNPEVRALSEDFRIKECQACHLPQPVSITGFAQRTLPRTTRPDEGIGCITCHLGPNGEILARNAVADAPCKPVASAELVAVAQCESCHNQHWTTDQWRETRYAAEGIGCSDCHMLAVDRSRADGSKRGGRSHVFPGGHDLTMVRSAVEFEAVVEGSELVVSLANTAAGHNFPTEERSRAADIEYRFVVEGAEPAGWERAHRFRLPYRDEPLPDTTLPHGRTETVRISIPDDAARAEVRLWYRRKPYAADDDPECAILFERSVEVR